MCGRFTQASSWNEAAELFDLDGELPELEARYNIAPTQSAVVVRREAGGRRRARSLKWGLVPRGAADPRIGSRLINARSETARWKPSFRDAFAARRCLVPVDGFYEWARRGGRKHPWRLRLRTGGFFALAGLWERWFGAGTGFGPEEKIEIETFTILTTAANALVGELHDRMPVIVAPGDFGRWLGGGEIPFEPFPAEAMAADPVSPRVNDPRNDDPRCIAPVPPPGEPRRPPSLFG